MICQVRSPPSDHCLRRAPCVRELLTALRETCTGSFLETNGLHPDTARHMHTCLKQLPLSITILILFAHYSCSRSVNRTIDDQSGDSVTGILPRYEPPAAWQHGNGCKECIIRPDPSQVYKGTWRDTTLEPLNIDPFPSPHTITIQFVGAAVYVYNLLANTVDGYPNGKPPPTTLTFALDGESAGDFSHTPTSAVGYEYNALVYSNDNLADAGHTLLIQATGDWSLVLFDYVIYTSTEPDPLPSTSPTPSSSPLLSSASSTNGAASFSSPHRAASTSTSSSTSSSSTSSTRIFMHSSSSDTHSLQAGSQTPSLPLSLSSTSTTSAALSTSPIGGSPPRPGNHHTEAAIGGALGGGALIVLIAAFLWFQRRRRSPPLDKTKPAAHLLSDRTPPSVKADMDSLDNVTSPSPSCRDVSNARRTPTPSIQPPLTSWAPSLSASVGAYHTVRSLSESDGVITGAESVDIASEDCWSEVAAIRAEIARLRQAQASIQRSLYEAPPEYDDM
ncbi:hypothetical protein C8Q76DRAFT_180794 [Earliella scabrosa]|nr:hypothetical protein C8Q76DRAFT_180794 [Earliella scabrosa]